MEQFNTLDWFYMVLFFVIMGCVYLGRIHYIDKYEEAKHNNDKLMAGRYERLGEAYRFLGFVISVSLLCCILVNKFA